MSERVLNALMRLFAMLANPDSDSTSARIIIEAFLKKHLNREQTIFFLSVYDGFIAEQKDGTKTGVKKRKLAVNSVKVVLICNQISAELTRRQKFVVLMNLLEFVISNGSISEGERELVHTVSECFHFSQEEFELCFKLATAPSISEVPDSENFLLISEKRPADLKMVKHLQAHQLSGEIGVIRISHIGLFFARYFGSDELLINGQLLVPGKIYTLYHGSSFQNSRIQTIYYSDISGCFFNEQNDHKIEFIVKNIEYRFKNQTLGLHRLSFRETSGRMVGIMGGSGAGKSTLLNVLNGNYAPSSGEVLINGINVHRHKNLLEGEIGYVPQDDLLVEDLTVYQNLYYNAKLCFGNEQEPVLVKKVITLLNSLGLAESKNLKVGNALENVISGGQRKRLNIALELIREPSVLFLDEPTSGLSSRDSENVMDLLKELTQRGKLVFVVIHQPSSDIFKMFDSLLLLDSGGYPIYSGDPSGSITYFKGKLGHVNAMESECAHCGNVNPEQVFNMIETKVLDENGNPTADRRVSPAEWNEFYNSQPAASLASEIKKTEPEKKTRKNRKPGFFQQMQVFVTRDVMAKLANRQYLAINFLEAPLLALVLALLVKYYKKGDDYIFYENKNIPAYLFMCILVALFVGLMVSAEEIFKDRKILKRESFLNLSKGSYLLSKISVLFFISTVQTLSFVLIGNYILEIKGMNLAYWLVLFSTSCFANMLGLNISSAFNSAISIYILIPFLLIPQILLSGALVKFDQLNPNISHQTLVPLEGDIMASRWAFEALVVEQFSNNRYEKSLFQYDKQKSMSEFKRDEWVSLLNDYSQEVIMARQNGTVNDEIRDKFKTLDVEIRRESEEKHKIRFKKAEKLTLPNFDTTMSRNISDYLNEIRLFYTHNYNRFDEKRDKVITGDPAYKKNLKNEFENERISNLARNITIDDFRKSTVENNRIVPLKNPVFRDGSQDYFIRSHFFAPRKNVFGRLVNTLWVNIAVIWTMSAVLWLMLYYNVIRKVIDFLSEGRQQYKFKLFREKPLKA